MRQERKNKVLAVCLTLLMAISTGIYFANSRPSENVNKDIFIVQDLNTIDRIVLQSVRDTIDLHYDRTRWKVNNKFRAEPNMIKVLFATLAQHQPKRPVPAYLKDSISNLLERDGVKVTLFTDTMVVKTFYAGGNKTKTQAYFKDPESGEVYLMVIPGYRVYVSGIYELDESGFRDKRVFVLPWTNFRKLTAVFPGKPNEDFTVSMQNDFFTIEGMQSVDTARLNIFGDDLALLAADRISSDKRVLDSLSRKIPVMEITIEDVADRKYALRLFYDAVGKSVVGWKDDEVLYFNSEQVRPILRPKSFFTKQ